MKAGIDIVKISRMTEKIALRILGEEEKRIYDSLDHPLRKQEFAAGRFAAKEAFVKASGRKDIPFSAIEFLSNEDGSPGPSGALLEIAGSAVTVSISHEKEYAIAVVILF